MSTKELVLVTGGSGFIGAWCIIKCLDAGYRVRTTVRSLKREQEVRDMLAAGKATNPGDVSFVEADLTKDAGWSEAVNGCKYVLHVASPFPPSVPKNEDDLIIPAREGTLRVLRAAKQAGVKRVVVTSSVAAIFYGEFSPTKVLTEKDWTPTDSKAVPAYQKSKTIAERAAWAFIEKEGDGLELSCVNPGAVMGPVLGKDYSSSIQIVERLLNANMATMPACPQIAFSTVDVRDVADLHLLAMTHPKAAGERFMAIVDPPMSIKDVSLVLHKRLGAKAKRAPKGELPNFVLNLASLWDPAIALIKPELGKVKKADPNKAKDTLGWQPRSAEDGIVATAESLYEFGAVKA